MIEIWKIIATLHLENSTWKTNIPSTKSFVDDMDLVASDTEDKPWLIFLTAEWLSSFPILPKNAIAQTLKILNHGKFVSLKRYIHCSL